MDQMFFVFALSSIHTNSRAHTGLRLTWLFTIYVDYSLSYMDGMLGNSDWMIYIAIRYCRICFLLFGATL